MPYVNGVYMGAPGSAVVVNDSQFNAPTTTGGLGTLFIGPGTDGEPNTLYNFTTPAQATATIKGGDGLQAVLNAFAGANKGPGTLSSVSWIRPEQATQATSNIQSSGAVTQIVLTTTSYGTLANSSKWMVQTASTTGYKVSQATDFVGPGGQTYPAPPAQDNINLPIITIACTATTPTVTITDTSFEVLSAGTSLITVTLSSSVTVQQLVNQLNQISSITATVADPNPQDATGALFDNLTSQSISATASTLYGNVTAVVRYFNNANLYFTAVRQANATSLATSSAWTYATGGTTPTASNSDWQNAYTTAQSVSGIALIAPASSSTTIWAMNDAHCAYMASIGQPRKGYVGDASGQTLATELTNASALNSQYTSVVWPEQKGTDYNGNSTTFAPYLVAASIMGQRAATPAQDALTQQPVLSNGMGQTVTPSMVAQGLAGGLCILAPDQSGTVVCQQDRTTWLQSTAYDKVENSTGLVVNLITIDLLATLQPFIGKPVSQTQVALAADAILNRLVYFYGLGYLVTAPSASDISLTGSGNTITGNVNAAVAVPTDYIVLQLTPTATTVAA